MKALGGVALAVMLVGSAARGEEETSQSEAGPAPSATPSPGLPPVGPPPAGGAGAVWKGPVLAPTVQIHGFVSGGGFYSTKNDFIGHSSRGSLELFEGAVNVSTELSEKLHAGAQFFSQDEGTANDATPRLDWAFLDYRWKPWLGIRAGRVRIPFGLYNDYIDIDSSRVQILLPQGVYPIGNREILTAQDGFAVYGSARMGGAGSIDYQAYSGVLSVPISPAQDPAGTRIYGYDSKYLAGGQVFWRLPVEGLRVGASLLWGAIDENAALSPALTAALIASGQAPPTFNGDVTVSLEPADLVVGSAEYVRGDWTFAAEYSRWVIRASSSPVNLVNPATSDSERLYALATCRLSDRLDTGVYLSVLSADAYDRNGTNQARFPQSFDAWSRDAAATARYDITGQWLVKLEGHFIDGAASLDPTLNPNPQRYWGLVLARTTVTF